MSAKGHTAIDILDDLAKTTTAIENKVRSALEELESALVSQKPLDHVSNAASILRDLLRNDTSHESTSPTP